MIEKYEIFAILSQVIWLIGLLVITIFCIINLAKKKTLSSLLMVIGSVLWFLSDIANIFLSLILTQTLAVEDFVYYQQLGNVLSNLFFVVFVIGFCMLIVSSLKTQKIRIS